jgi:hypothetical protein
LPELVERGLVLSPIARRRCFLSLVIIGIGAAAGAAPPPPAAGEPPVRTADPAHRKWEITNYVKGTAEEIKATLDKEVVAFDEKVRSAQSDLRKIDEEYARNEKFLLDQARKAPAYAEALARVEKAKADVDAAKSAPLDQRMSASSRLNKLKQDVQKFDRAATAGDKELASVRKQQAALRERVAKLTASLDKSLEWRAYMVSAISNTFSLYGPVVPGKSFGIIDRVRTVEVRADGTVLATYTLVEPTGQEKGGEGLVNLKYSDSVVPILLHGLPNANALKPDQELQVYRTFKVTKLETLASDLPPALVLEPYETDWDYLLKTVVPLPIEPPAKAPTSGGKAPNPAPVK